MNLSNYTPSPSIYKKLTKPHKNLLAKLGQMGVEIDPTNGFVRNPSSGYSETIDPLMAVLVRWVYEVYSTYGSPLGMNFHGTKISVSVFDRVRHLILAVDNKTFFNFID